MAVSDARKAMECPYKLEPAPKRLCIDLDGCVVQYPWSKMVKDYFGVDISPEEIYAYDIPNTLGVSQKDTDTMFTEQVYGKPSFIEGAIDTLKEWKSKGYELIIFSNRVKYMGYEGLARWLIDWQFPFSGIDGGQGSYDVHIDDSPAKLMATDSKIKLLYSQPWNKRCFNITGKLIRMKNWEGIRVYVQACF